MSASRRVRLIACVAAFAAAGGVSPAASAEPSASELKLAKDMVHDAIKEEKGGKCDDAIAMLKQAQAIKETAELYLHLGECQTKLGALVDGLRSWEKGEELARAEKDRATQQAIGAKLLAIRERIPTVMLRVPADAKHLAIKIDDKDVPAERAGAPIEVDPGDHTINVTADDRKPFSAKVTVAEKESKVVAAALPELAAATENTTPPVDDTAKPDDTTAPPPDENEKPKVPAVTWVSGGASIVLLATGFVLFGAAGGAASSGRDACATQVACDPSDTKKVRTLDSLALTMWIGSGIAAGVAVTTFALSRSSKPKTPPASATVLLGPSSISLRGAF